MLEGNYIEKINKKVKAKFEWIEEYIKEYYKGTILERYSNVISKFCIKYNEIFFDFNNLKILFRDEENWKIFGNEIFRFIFFTLIYKDIERFLKEHRAENVKMLIDIISYISTPLNILDYSKRVSEKIIEHANIISTKKDVEEFFNLLNLNK